MATWANGAIVNAPTIADVKTDASITDTRDDARLQMVLDAAIAKVVELRTDLNFAADPLSAAPYPDHDVWLGTVRLAHRWHVRRRSPDAAISMGDLGTSRVPMIDMDIERLLGIGRFSGPVFA